MLKKLKAWLIHRLGGYTLHDVLDQPVKLTINDVLIMKVVREVNCYDLITCKNIHNELAYKKNVIKMKLLDDLEPYIHFESYHDPIRDALTLRGTIIVGDEREVRDA